jgi:ABC-2 type transport system permease protein
MGPVLGSMGDYLADNPTMAEMLGIDPTAGDAAMVEGFSAVLILYIAMLSGAGAISAVGAFAADERQGLVARQLAEAVPRTRLLGSTAGAATACALVGFSAGAGAYALVVALDSTLSPSLALGVAGAALRAFPGLIATVALAVFLVAAVPRLAALSWAPFGYAFLQVILGPMLRLPDWTRYLSPLSAAPYSPAAEPDWPALTALLAVAAVLTWAALRRFRARDLLA